MNIKNLREQLEFMTLDISSDLSDDEKMEFFNNEISSYLQSLTEIGILHDFMVMCDSSNQYSDDTVRADIAVIYPNQENFYYIQLNK